MKNEMRLKKVKKGRLAGKLANQKKIRTIVLEEAESEVQNPMKKRLKEMQDGKNSTTEDVLALASEKKSIMEARLEDMRAGNGISLDEFESL